MARAPRLSIEFAGDTPIYESENGRWVLYKDHVAEVAAAEQQRDRLLEAARTLSRHTLGFSESRAVAEAKETIEQVEKEKADAS